MTTFFFSNQGQLLSYFKLQHHQFPVPLILLNQFSSLACYHLCHYRHWLLKARPQESALSCQGSYPRGLILLIFGQEQGLFRRPVWWVQFFSCWWEYVQGFHPHNYFQSKTSSLLKTYSLTSKGFNSKKRRTALFLVSIQICKSVHC